MALNKRRTFLTALGGVALLAALGGAVWLMSLPGTPAPKQIPPIAQAEVDATLAALKPPKRQRPVIAIIGVNEGTEVTDYLMPYGILQRADVADVIALATKPGPVKLYPALQVQPQATIDEFDATHADGADYVIVPAMHRADDPVALQWIRSQAQKGAVIIGVCVGAMVVAETGLLDGKRATTHWYSLKGMRERHPSIEYVPNRRIVVDRGVATTTGISASMPMSLTLIEAIAGREKAEAVARDIGLPHWDARHDSHSFLLTQPFAQTVIANTLAFWNRERLGIELQPGVDEVSLALVADMWSRTYRSQAVTFASSAEARRSRGGLLIIPDEGASNWPTGQRVPAIGEALGNAPGGTRPEAARPADALRQGLHAIADRYGKNTARVVAMQLEYSM